MPTDSNDLSDSFQSRGEEHAREAAGSADIVYAPAHPSPEPGSGVVRFETRRLSDGEAVGLAFRSQSALVDALGPAQPWMALSLSRLEKILGAAGIKRVLINPPVDDSAAWWTPERMSALAKRLEGDHG